MDNASFHQPTDILKSRLYYTIGRTLEDTDSRRIKENSNASCSSKSSTQISFQFHPEFLAPF